MKLEHQVTSLEISKRLKELGVKQESLFWHDLLNNKIQTKEDRDDFLEEGAGWGPKDFISAFTVAELGNLIGHTNPFGMPEFIPEKSWEWREYHGGGMATTHTIQASTEADARGAMLIYLLENKLI